MGQTRVLSANTDGLIIRIGEGDEDRVRQVVRDWEASCGLSMEWADIIEHRQLNVNNYVSLVREQGKDAVEVKGKG
jgi:hypothetical protein